MASSYRFGKPTEVWYGNVETPHTHPGILCSPGWCGLDGPYGRALDAGKTLAEARGYDVTKRQFLSNGGK